VADERGLCCSELQRLAGLPDEDIDLAKGALAIAADAYPELDFCESLAILDALADQARPRLESVAGAAERVRALAAFLHEEVGFRGNLDAYYDPRNSYLNDVLSRGLGIPITLAVIYIEVAKRLGLELKGVNFPGHFLLRYEGAEGPLFLDPFDPTRFMCPGDCKALLCQMSEGKVTFDDRFLEPATSRQVLVRMLKNLKLVHFQQGQLEKAVRTIDRILMIAPDQTLEYRDRGVAFLKLEDHRAALDDLTRYLELVPGAADRVAVQATVRYLEMRVEPLN
jgi:regulator of sirC expression with transglutaminase-like and TPR domain